MSCIGSLIHHATDLWLDLFHPDWWPIIGVICLAIVACYYLIRYVVRVRKGIQPSSRAPSIYNGVYDRKESPSLTGASPESGDPEFRDEELERLIEDGELIAARKYLREVIQVAREMNEMKVVRNYEQYEARISKAATDSRRMRGDDGNW